MIISNKFCLFTFVVQEGEFNVFAKSTRIVVHGSDRITERLKQRIHLKYLRFKSTIARA